MTIWKYYFDMKTALAEDTPDRFTLRMPRGSKILHCALQGEQPTLWALVDSQAPDCIRRFAIYGTGAEISMNEKNTLPLGPFLPLYLGTYQLFGGTFVWHLFEESEEQEKTS
jgi:hypothetical protein